MSSVHSQIIPEIRENVHNKWTAKRQARPKIFGALDVLAVQIIYIFGRFLEYFFPETEATFIQSLGFNFYDSIFDKAVILMYIR